MALYREHSVAKVWYSSRAGVLNVLLTYSIFSLQCWPKPNPIGKQGAAVCYLKIEVLTCIPSHQQEQNQSRHTNIKHRHDGST